MSEQYLCWHCGALLKDLILPLSRREQCSECHADQHVCCMCINYRPQLHSKCDEERADPPREKEDANFCDYFKPDINAFTPINTQKAASAKAELEALFGDTPTKTESVDGKSLSDSHQSKKDKALEDLKRLFGED